ncbi:MAG: hypothetical protein ACLFU6_11700, partial [Candidatus Hydrogenedentota bacterium]
MKTKIMLTLLGAAVAFGTAGCPEEVDDAAPEERGRTLEEEPEPDMEPGSEPGSDADSMPDMEPGSEP